MSEETKSRKPDYYILWKNNKFEKAMRDFYLPVDKDNNYSSQECYLTFNYKEGVDCSNIIEEVIATLNFLAENFIDITFNNKAKMVCDGNTCEVQLPEVQK